MLTEIKSNILDTDCDIIGHGVNCQNVMGSGIARALFEKWPEVKEQYHMAFEIMPDQFPEQYLGYMQPVELDGIVVVNLFTQQNFGNDGQVYLSYNALKQALHGLKEYCHSWGYKTIALPKIGCGLAGGNWDKVKPIIEEILEDFTVKVYYLD